MREAICFVRPPTSCRRSGLTRQGVLQYTLLSHNTLFLERQRLFYTIQSLSLHNEYTEFLLYYTTFLCWSVIIKTHHTFNKISCFTFQNDILGIWTMIYKPYIMACNLVIFCCWLKTLALSSPQTHNMVKRFII